MAMIHCQECGNKISDSAKSCPSCGFETKQVKEVLQVVITKQDRNLVNRLFRSLFIIANVILIFLLIGFLLIGANRDGMGFNLVFLTMFTLMGFVNIPIGLVLYFSRPKKDIIK